MTAKDIKEYIFKNDKVSYILESLGCHKIAYHNKYYSAAMPDGDNPNGVNISNDSYLSFISYSRNIGFDKSLDIFDLIKQIRHINFRDVLLYLHDILHISTDTTYQTQTLLKYNPIAWLDRFDKVRSDKVLTYAEYNSLQSEIIKRVNYEYIPHEQWLTEIVSKYAYDKFGVGFSYRYKRIYIPIKKWNTGSVVAYNARTTISHYDFYGISKFYTTVGYNKHNNLYGFYENRLGIKDTKKIILFEAEKSVIRFEYSHIIDWDKVDFPIGKINNSVALQGHTISDTQIDIMLQYSREVYNIQLNEIIIAMDKDVDKKEIIKMAERIYKVAKIFNCKVSYIYDNNNLLDEKQSPIDKGLKTFTELYRERTIYEANN